MLTKLRLYEGSSGPELRGDSDNQALVWDATAGAWKPGTGAAGGVSSVFGRTGVVTAQANDYSADQITGGLFQVASAAARNAIPAPNRQVGQTVYQVDTDEMWRLIGGTANANWVDVTVKAVSNLTPGVVPAVGASSFLLQSTGTAAAWVAPLLYDAGFLSPTITQAATLLATGQKLTLRAQDAATTGGGLELGSGSGGTSPGELSLFAGATKVASLARSNVSDFFALGATPAGAGFLRLPAGAGIKSREQAGAFDLDVYSSGTGFNSQVFGSALSGVTRYQAGAGGVVLTVNTVDVFSILGTVCNFFVPELLVGAAAGAAGFTARIANTNSGSSALGFLRLRAMGTTNGNTNGADVEIEGGRPNGTGLSGGVKLKLNTDDTQANMSIMLQAANLATGRRILSLCYPGAAGAGVTTTQMGANTGDLVAWLGNANVDPSAAPGAGGLIFGASGGNLQIYTPNANKTTVGAAGGAAALPATPTSYIPLKYNGVSLCIPAYAP